VTFTPGNNNSNSPFTACSSTGLCKCDELNNNVAVHCGFQLIESISLPPLTNILQLWFGSMTEVPAFFLTEKLEVLHVEFNNLTRVPVNSAGFPKLRELKLNNNSFDSLGFAELSSDAYPALEVVSFDRNSITAVSAGLLAGLFPPNSDLSLRMIDNPSVCTMAAYTGYNGSQAIDLQCTCASGYSNDPSWPSYCGTRCVVCCKLNHFY
jgi:hypothetical protein